MPTACAYNPSSAAFFVAVGRDVYVFSARTGALQRVFSEVSSSEVCALVFDSRQRRVMVAGQDGSAAMYNSINGALMKVRKPGLL